MILADDFLFTQANLQDFVDCRRRFEQRHVLRVSWPAIEAEPALENERRLERGAQFHLLARQFYVGIPEDRLTESTADEEIGSWWRNFLANAPKGEPGTYLPEISLVGEVAGYRVAARYDLVHFQPGARFTIYDWKTSTARPQKKYYENRLQTLVYPLLLVLSGAHLNQGEPIPARQVEMVYWFAQHPDQTVRFPYSRALHQGNLAYLTTLIEEIKESQPGEFPLTKNQKHCKFCVYRSLCDRGKEAGDLDDSAPGLQDERDPDLDFDFDQVAEIEF